MGGMDDLYREQILEHHRAPHNFGTLEQPSVSIDGRNPSCGDVITMQLLLSDAGIVEDVAFSGRGCAISQASASLLTDELRGKRADEVLAWGSPFVMEILGVEVGPTRVHCALVGLETAQKAIDEANALRKKAEPLLAARQRLGKGKIVVPTPAQSQASSTALRKNDPEFVAWVDKFLAESYKSGQTQKWYEAALKDFGLDPALAPPIMKEMIK